MLDFLFYLFAALTLAGGLMVVLSRNAVNGAMWMILAFVGTAALFALMEAFFLAVLQVLVYAGAVIVLFLFIIMLLDTESQGASKQQPASIFAAVVGLALLVAGLFWILGSLDPSSVGEPMQATPAANVKSFGSYLFTKFLLPVQVSGFLLLTAMIGVILISKRRPAADEGSVPVRSVQVSSSGEEVDA